MPPAFEAYARILHRINAHYENIDNPLSAKEITLLNIPTCEPLMSLVKHRRANGQGPRIKWKDLTELLGVPFVAEMSGTWFRSRLDEACWPRFLRPGKEWPIGSECTELASRLQAFVGKQPCFFRLSDIPFIGKTKPPLFRGSPEGVSDFLRTEAFSYGFEHWWPSDQSWCLCSDYDLECTIVGGSKALISGLLASSILECIETTPRSRVDPFAPMPR